MEFPKRTSAAGGILSSAGFESILFYIYAATLFYIYAATLH